MDEERKEGAPEEEKKPEEGQGGAEEKEKPVTQDAINRIYKEMRETKEMLDRAEGTNAELVGRLAELESQSRVMGGAPAPAADEDLPLAQKYTEQNFPQTKEEWDDLIAEEPTYGVDLRASYLAKQANTRNEFETKQGQSREIVEGKHPEMFLRDATGSFILDKDGKKQIDKENPKAQIFVNIVNRDLSIMNSATWPELAMAAMENQLSGKKEEEVAKELEEEKKKEEAKRQEEVKAGGVASGGGEPPAEKPKVEVKFNSPEEKAHAEGLVSSGRIKSLEDFCAVRDNQVIGYGRGGF